MRKLTVITHVTLDGVMQAPGRPDEDTRGGFGRGGWAQAGNDHVMADFMGVGRGGDPVALLLGRRTYQDFFGFWPHQPDNPYTESLTKQQKYVASRTLAEPLPWQNSTLLPGDAASAVAALKPEPGPDLLVLGSGELVGRRVRAADPPADPRPGPAAVPGGRPRRPPADGKRHHHDRRHHRALPGGLTDDGSHPGGYGANISHAADASRCGMVHNRDVRIYGDPELRLTGVKRHDEHLAGHVG
jgi:dihydrofolate reductase